MAKYILTIELMQGNDNYHGCHSLTKSWVPVCRSLCIFERKCRELNQKKIFCSQFMACKYIVVSFSLHFWKKVPWIKPKKNILFPIYGSTVVLSAFWKKMPRLKPKKIFCSKVYLTKSVSSKMPHQSRRFDALSSIVTSAAPWAT
jgi:hypothetical protein